MQPMNLHPLNSLQSHIEKKRINTFTPSPKNNQQTASIVKKKACPQINQPLGYRLATNQDFFAYDQSFIKEVKPLIFKIDLNNDGKLEKIKIFIQEPRKEMNGIKSKPIIIQVLGKKEGCFQEVFRFGEKKTANNLYWRDGNEIGHAEAIADFWGDGKNVFIFIPIDTGYGSGYIAYLNFLTFNKGQFKVVPGPELDELSDFKFSVGAAPGKVIWVSDSIWTENESHFGPHRCKVEKWIWRPNKEEYKKIEVETTKNHYAGCKIDDILSTEKLK